MVLHTRNIENNGQHPSLQIFFELMLCYNISVDQFLLDTPTGKDTKWRQLDALLDDMSDNGIRIVTATAKEISEGIKIANAYFSYVRKEVEVLQDYQRDPDSKK